MVFVCGCTELQSGKFLDVTLEYVCHIIVELVAERAYMHGHNGFIEFLFMVAYLCGKKLEVGNGAGVVEFDGVGIQADKLYPSCNEGEIGVSEYCTISLFARAQAVVIAEKYHIGYLEFVHNVPLPKELVCYTAFVQPIRDTYRNYDDVQRMRVIMSILGFAILFIAALNYVLISISSLSYRAKSVGVHKCSGASGGTVFSMFLLETGIIIVAALLLMVLIMLNFRDFVEDTVVVKLSTLLAPERIWVPLSVVLLLFIVGGVLPGRLFARIPVSQVFRRYTEGKKGWKRPLLFVQFAGVAFISGLMCVVMSQYQYVLKKDMGYNPKQIAIGNAYWDNEATRDAAYQFFKGLPYVEAVSSANSTPISGYSGSMIHSESGQALFSCRSSYFMREDFPALMGMTMKTGRMARDKEEVVVNETFAEMMRWGDDVVGRTVYTEGNTFKVVGQLKDFQIESFRTEKMPFIARGNKNFYGTVHVRLKEPFTENLQKLNRDVAEAFHDQTIDFTGYEKRIENSYNSVRVFRNATLMAAVTMFFIMLMGLIGYTTDEVRRRSKEIAIRKVNGAEASGILEMLSRDILVVAAPAVVIGTVLAWYVNGMWMEQFAERIPVSWAVYVLVVMANLVIIVACVLWKSWRIANENPVNSIKSE